MGVEGEEVAVAQITRRAWHQLVELVTLHHQDALLTLALGIDPVVQWADIVDGRDLPQVIGMMGTEGGPVLSECDDAWLSEAILLQVVRGSDRAEDLQLLKIGEDGEDSGAIGLSLEGMCQTPTAIGLAHHRGCFSAHG